MPPITGSLMRAWKAITATNIELAKTWPEREVGCGKLGRLELH